VDNDETVSGGESQYYGSSIGSTGYLASAGRLAGGSSYYGSSYATSEPLPGWHKGINARRQLWRRLFFAVGMVITGAGAAIGLPLSLREDVSSRTTGWVVIAVAAAAGIVLATAGDVAHAWLEDRARTKLSSAVKASPVEDSGLSRDERRRRFAENAFQQALDDYGAVSRSQAVSAYRIAQMAAIAGLLLLGGGAAVAIYAQDTAAQIIVGGLAGLGSAISGYISATSLRMYDRAINQMNFTSAQPLVGIHLLKAQELAEKLADKERQDSALELVVARTLDVASTAAGLLSQTRSAGYPAAE
jgi:hypothetical protein